MKFPEPFFRWRPHPWHGVEVGPNAPEIVHAYIEITPFDSVKYEVDKTTGYLRVDRPQRSSSQPPALYGFIPRTYCGDRVGAMSQDATQGDGDPLDICVISERPIDRAEILLNARVIGGLQMIDGGEADDKIVAIRPFGKTGAKMIGFLTNEDAGVVFIPSSPNPLSGQVYAGLAYEVLESWTYEDVIKYNASVGLVRK